MTTKAAASLVTATPVAVRLDEAARTDAALEREVDRLWAAHGTTRGLRDDAILSFVRLDGATVWSRAVPYRYFLAQRLAPELRDGLGVEPLAVTGLLRIERSGGDLYAVARRADGVTQYPGHWEVFPAGHLEPDWSGPDGTLDVVGQLLRRQLYDETGVWSVRDVRWIGLFHDGADGVWDLAYEIRTAETPRTGDEHDEMRLLTARELHAFAATEVALVPTSRAIIEARR